MQLAINDQCTGCGACKAICPNQAIAFSSDHEGFPTPSINSERCINCGSCNIVCPSIHMPETRKIQAAYAAQIRDKETLLQSTSGGLFTVFAREIFRRNGVAYGCIWDNQYNAVIQKAENEEGIKPMRGSKYVWSWAGDCFEEIKSHLESGRTVMFTGLPCQVAGLRNYLKIDYDHLYTVDFLCSGCPSPMVFKSWLKTIQGSASLSELNLKFRDKTQFGVGVHITYKGQKHRNLKTGEHIRNPYYYGFYIRLFDRLSCYRCPYGTDNRVSDLTICDFWGVSDYHTDMNISAGISGLMINSLKGENFVSVIHREVHLEKTDIRNIARANNLSLDGTKNNSCPNYREDFINLVSIKGWKVAKRKYLYNKTRLKLWIKTKLPQRTFRLLSNARHR